jgi:hypothetical protein
MDLSNLSISAHDGEWLPINAPDGTHILDMLIVGRDSTECKEASRIASANVRKMKGEIKPEKLEDDNKKTVIACIKDWRDPETLVNEITFKGEKLKCNYTTKRQIIDEFPFIYRQVDAYIVDDANFFKVLAKN